MKRCRHCGQQDNEDAIICKQCLKYFNAPASPPAVGARPTPARKGGSALGLIVRLVAFVVFAAFVSGAWPDIRQRIEELLRSNTDQVDALPQAEPDAATAAVSEPPAAAAPEAAKAPTKGATSSPRSAAPEPDPPPRAAPELAPPPSPPSLPVPAATDQPIRVGGQIKAPQKIRDQTPEYPKAARSARVQGIVILEATIDPAGRVTTTRVLRSIPLLDQAAVDAVKQWEYEPTMVNGVKVPIIMTVTVRFTLQ